MKKGEFDAEAWPAAFGIAAIVSVGFLYMGLAQRLLRKHGLSLLSEGILYEGIVHSVSATFQSKQIYLSLDVDFQQDATPWSAQGFAQVSQGTPLPTKGARVAVMVKPNKPGSAAVYVGQAGLLVGKAKPRKG